MFPKTRAMMPLRIYTSFAPETDLDIFSREIGEVPGGTIRRFLNAMSGHPGMGLIRKRIIEDMSDLRDAQLLGAPLESPGRRIDYLGHWNAFLHGDNDEEITRTIAAPVVAMIESTAVQLFTVSKTRRGPLRERHLNASLDLSAASRRLALLEPFLDRSLACGTTPEHAAGARTSHNGSGYLHVKLLAGRPKFERARAVKNVVTWHPVQIQAIQAEPECDLQASL